MISRDGLGEYPVGAEGTFRSAAWRGSEFKIDTLPVTKPGPGEIRVRVVACGVCITEVHFIDGLFDGFDLPDRFGHEFGGEVDAVGAGVQAFKVGDAVGAVGSFGGFGEVVVDSEELFHGIPSEVPLHHACFLEPVSACVNAVKKGGVPFGESVLITGAGSNGLLILQLARLSGASPIIVSEPNPRRRALATECGADKVLDPSESTVADQLAGEAVNVAFETAGHPTAVRECLDVVSPGGRVVMFGVSSDTARLELPLWKFHMSEISLIATMGFDREATDIAATLLPRLQIEPLVSDRYQLDELATAFDAARSGDGLKALVYPVVNRCSA